MPHYSYRSKSKVQTTNRGSWRSLNVASGTEQEIDISHYEKKYRVSNLALVAAPGSSVFLNPLRIPGLRDRLFKKWQIDQIIVHSLITIGAVVLLSYVFIDREVYFELKRTAVVSALFAAVVLSFFMAGNGVDQLADRIDLIRFLRLHLIELNKPTIIVAVVGSLVLYEGWDDMQFVYAKYGSVSYEVVEPHAWWRFLTGPFVHSGPRHLFANVLTLMLLFPLACLDDRLFPVMTFAAGCIMSHITFVVLRLLDFHGQDLLLGASGGGFALQGAIIISAILEPDLYPKNFYINMIGFAVLGLFGAMIMSINASEIAHFSGLFSGMAVYLAIRFYFSIATDKRR